MTFDLPGQFWRGNLHTHSNLSDASPATRILLSGGHPGAEVAQGTDLTECTLPPALVRGAHCRITVEDATGGRAWTNPIHLLR